MKPTTNPYLKKDDIEYHIKISPRARRITIVMDRNCNVFVRVPEGRTIFAKYKIDKLIQSNHEKIIKFVKRRKVVQAEMSKLSLTETLEIKGYFLQFELNSEKDNISVIKDGNKIKVLYPENTDQDKIIQDAKPQILRIFKKIAEEIILPKVNEIAALHNLKYEICRIRNVKTIWGSCSKDNKITLSSKLLMLDWEFIEYVIMHELMHTKHKHHKPIFFKDLSIMLNKDAKTIDRKINKQKHPLFEIYKS